ncbi:hypothetical protein [Nocardia blacklockiae]|uniref:hypothetical protein n=1 Tax=Nocardia blacklockiae TaxID=480036 RepID=UPI001894B00D|nr:hypothetical protein [Nocardia blacklockiae]MBF6175642.1 hypothetical protein [Nocardia blacklockiae]
MLLQVDQEILTAIGSQVGVGAMELLQAANATAAVAVPPSPGSDFVSQLFPFVLGAYNVSMVSCTTQGCSFGAEGGHALPTTAVSFSGGDVISGGEVAVQSSVITTK